jgi:hypothetical protein
MLFIITFGSTLQTGDGNIIQNVGFSLNNPLNQWRKAERAFLHG